MSAERKSSPVQERAQELSLPKDIERKEGVKARPHHFKPPNIKHKGSPIASTAQTMPVTITLPRDESTLVEWSKGSLKNARTWFGAFFVRMVEKAKVLGWKVQREKK